MSAIAIDENQVSDTGIEKSQLQQVFEPFYRGQKTARAMASAWPSANAYAIASTGN